MKKLMIQRRVEQPEDGGADRKYVAVDPEIHRWLRIYAARTEKTMREVVDGIFLEARKQSDIQE